MTPIVLIPGLMSTAEIFTPQVAALWPYGPVTVASTLAGATIAEMAASILATAPPRFALGGLSMGGYICLEIMRQAPERVIKLALLSTQAGADTPETIAQRRAMMAYASTNDFAAMLSQTMAMIVHPKHLDDPALRAVNRRMGATLGIEEFVRQTEAVIARIDSRADLAAIKVPTLVLVGEDDKLIPPERSEEMAAAIPGARLGKVPECGHESTLEQPEAVNRALVEWISG